jgi:hypothetical protein
VKPVVDAFRYPLRRQNLGMLVLGLFVLSFLPTLFSFIPIGGGVVSGVIDFFLLGYYALFLQSILHATMSGEDRIPAWPDAHHPFELFEELLAIVAPFIVSFLPLILLHASAAGFSALQSSGFILRSSMPAFLADGTPWRIGLEAALLIAGWLYLPMAILVQTFYGGSALLNPVAVARAAWQTGPSYLLLAFLVWAMVTAAWAVSLIPGQFITAFGSSLLVFYALIVAVRLLGTHYRTYRERLGWERGAPEPA